VCLGGGTELALACRWRIAADDDATRLALPEVKLGILPGWGGTWRLPRLIGVPAALDLMMSGREVGASAARRLGLVDEVAPAAALAESARAWVAGLLKAGDGRVRARRAAARGAARRWLVDANPAGRALACALAADRAARAAPAYPAPREIAALVGAQWRGGRAAALEREAQALGRMLASPEARSLLGLFFLTQEAKGAGPAAAPRPIARVGVVGGGLMGSGIATVFASRLLPVRIRDVSPADVGKALRHVADHFTAQARRRRLTPLAARDRMDRVSGGTSLAELAGADLVVEAVPEILALKRRVFAELEAVVRPDAILASNTSTLPIARIAEGLARPERVIGMHFFFPAPRMPLVEIIPSARTSPETVAAVVAVARACGKTAIVVKDAPGFLVNRILMPYLLEALILLEEGATVAAVDGAALAYGMPMGPVRLTAEVGPVVAQKAGEVILEAFKDRLEAPRLAAALGEPGLFAARGRGRVPVPAALEAAARSSGRPARAHGPGELQDRLLLAMVNEAAWCLGDGIVESAALLDLSLITGIGFPPFRGGLLRWADGEGAAAVAGRLEALAARSGPRFAPAPFLAALAKAGGRFRPD